MVGNYHTMICETPNDALQESYKKIEITFFYSIEVQILGHQKLELKMWAIPVFASITCTVPVKQQIQIDSSDLKQKVVNTSSSVVAVLNTTSTECTGGPNLAMHTKAAKIKNTLFFKVLPV